MNFSANKLTVGIAALNCYKPPRSQKRATANSKNHLTFMSQHRSLRAATTTGAKRNVLKRFERVELLKKRNQWKPGDRVMGLRKTKPEG